MLCRYVHLYVQASLHLEMLFVETNRRRYNQRYRRQRRLLRNLIVALSVVLLVLLVILLIPALKPQPTVQLHSELTMEAGDRLPEAKAFLAEESEATVAYEDSNFVWANQPGVYTVKLNVNGKSQTAKIRVVDTVAPTGATRDLTGFANAIPEAGEFLVSKSDVTEVTVRYLTAPDATKAGDQTVTLVLTDTSGNETTLTATLHLVVDNTPPTITGTKDITVYQGDAVKYMKDVTVWDSQDDKPELLVDKSQVNLNTPGAYTVTYTATDKAGNSTSVTVKLTVLEKLPEYVSYEEIMAEVDKVLADIIKDNMDTKQKAYQVYYWIRTNCTYADGSDKHDWMQAGYKMLMDRKGDCFNFFGLTKLMLERLEIPNIDVHKVKNHENDSNHYWSLVSVDGGETYYHLDTTPRMEFVNLFLQTDAFMDEYSAAHNGCFNRDKSLYPATPEVEP